MYQKITMKEALKYLNNGAIIIDCKTNKEYQVSHIDGAINIPLDKIVSVLSIVKDKNKTILVYCSTGKRSYKASLSLLNLGYKNVYDLDIKK